MVRRKKEESSIVQALRKSPINYFSDLFIVVVVAAWFAIIAVMVLVGIFLPDRADATIWSSIEGMVTVPLSGGVTAWMLKNAAAHNNASKRGEVAAMDLADAEIEGG